MVRNNHQHDVFTPAPLKSPCYQGIHTFIQLFDGVTPLIFAALLPSRMFFINIAPECMLNSVGTVKNTDTQTMLDLIEGIKKHLLTLFVHSYALLHEAVIAENFLIEGPTILGQAKRSEWALQLGKIGRVNNRIAERHGRFFRVDVHRCNV